ncbi:MAG: methyltransferase domain-containing protein [Bdellovibrionota bacterium]
MNWKIKALIQNAISYLPESCSYKVYYWVQRNFGGLRQVDPTSRLIAGLEIFKRISQTNCTFIGKTFLEVGTGRAIDLPLALWLLGADKVITVDLNPYLEVDLVKESINFIKTRQNEVRELFGKDLIEERFNSLIGLAATNFMLTDVFDLCSIEYLAPEDASDLQLPEESIDFHVSYTVFEHISSINLSSILKEGTRILKKDGLFVHLIDYSDHFSHSDDSISAINFLKFNDSTWSKIAGNKYMYCNRLREDDFVKLFEERNISLLKLESIKDDSLRSLLKSKEFSLDPQFKSKSEETLITTASWIIGSAT